jgi:hypothetical protein
MGRRRGHLEHWSSEECARLQVDRERLRAVRVISHADRTQRIQMKLETGLDVYPRASTQLYRNCIECVSCVVRLHLLSILHEAARQCVNFIR